MYNTVLTLWIPLRFQDILSISTSSKREFFRSSIWTTIFGFLQLNLEPLGPHLESVHGVNGSLCWDGVVKRDKAEALAEVSGTVYEDLSADYGSEGGEHLEEVRVRDVIG